MTDLVSFGFSFLVLISVWTRYSTIMSVLPIENRTTLLLNAMLLFLVSIEPYAFNLVSLTGHLYGYELDNYVSVIYALDMGGLMAILAFFAHELTIEERGLVSPPSMSRYRHLRNTLFVSAGLFFVTVLPPFWIWTVEGTPVRFYFWVIPLIVSWLRRAYTLPGKNSQIRKKE